MTDPLASGEHLATIRGTRLRYRVAGQGPVLIVQSPGWGVGSEVYESLAPLRRSFTVVTYDPRGSGATAGAPPEELHVQTFVEDLEALRRHLGLSSFALAGHSHGGLIALHYALAHPARVSSLVLLGAQLVGVLDHPDEVNAEVDPRDEPEIAKGYAFLESVGGFAAMFHARTDEEATAFLRGIGPLYFRDPSKAAPLYAFLDRYDIPVRTMQSVSATDGGFPLRERALRALPVRTLVVSGRYDVFCPPGPARRLAEMLPHAERVVFEKSGHFPWIEEPEAFFPAVAGFLARSNVIPAR